MLVKGATGVEQATCHFLNQWWPSSLPHICIHHQYTTKSIHWRHNEHNGVSNHRRLDCFLNQPFVQVQIKENIKAPRHWPLWEEFGGDRWPVNSPHKGPVTHKMFPFDDVIMWWLFHVYANSPVIPQQIDRCNWHHYQSYVTALMKLLTRAAAKSMYGNAFPSRS